MFRAIAIQMTHRTKEIVGDHIAPKRSLRVSSRLRHSPNPYSENSKSETTGTKTKPDATGLFLPSFGLASS